ncbi:MAG: hypothetical protein KDJ63_00030 [Nitratireductor sp.]|nr:hypothetical protein [Nitratireductor sp.]
MARVSISVPDDLKTQMDGRDDVNWSSIARRAFELEIQSKVIVEGNLEMNGVIERLRASKERGEHENRIHWIENGAGWAAHKAEFEELERMVDINPDEFDSNQALLERMFEARFDSAAGNQAELLGYAEEFKKNRLPSLNELTWWLDGVDQVWDEVADKL